MPLTILSPPRRRFTTQPSPEPAWQALHRIADSVYNALRDATMTALGTMRQRLQTSARAMRAALSTKSSLAVESTLAQAVAAGQQVLRATLPTMLTETVSRAAQAITPQTAAMLAEATGQVVVDLGVAFNVTNPQALYAIHTYIGEQITGIGERTLLTVRSLVHQGFEEGWGVPRLASELAGHIGLTMRQADAVATLRHGLVEQGMARAQMQQVLARDIQRKLQQRADAVARTESINAASLGQQLLWEEAERQGFWGEDMRRFWLVTPDDRLCPGCRQIPGLNPEGVRLRDPFLTPYGPMMHPTAHPLCRCSVTAQRVVV